MAALLKDALKPNLIQTLEHSGALHGGPFANIAHGCNSVMATRTAPEAWTSPSRRQASAQTWEQRNF